jgi:ubiquinone/menaquinone biosynthesis C-methylase UbiE
MGAPDPRDIIANSSGGIDWVGDRKRGKHLGANLIQGWLVDCDQGCDDMIHSRFAELEDGRRDMQQIHQPVTWICGEHDYWVNERRVLDIMTVKSPGTRELIRVPTGHFVRTSREAVAAFRLVASKVAGQVLAHPTPGRTPSAYTLQRAAELERARLKVQAFDAQSYWSSYLQGTKQNPLGFDLLALTDEYQELMTEQVTAMTLQPNERVADIGCGTGNGIEAIVQEFGRRCPGLRIDGVDFVPEALRQARSKFEEAASRIPQPPDATFHPCDLALPPEAPNLPFGDGTFDAILVGLVIPYLEDPTRLLREIARILRPGGRVVISSLRPDVDMSGPLRRLREKVLAGDDKLVEGWDKRTLLHAIQDYIHAAARLVDQEHEGRFRFYEREELETMLRRAGLDVKSTTLTFGNPKLGLVCVAARPGV